MTNEINEWIQTISISLRAGMAREEVYSPRWVVYSDALDELIELALERAGKIERP